MDAEGVRENVQLRRWSHEDVELTNDGVFVVFKLALFCKAATVNQQLVK